MESGSESFGTPQRYYFFSRHTAVDGKSAERYRCFDENFDQLLIANAFRSSRPSEVSFSGDLSTPEILIKLRKTFALTGKVNILDAKSSSLLGVVTRGRKLYDSNEKFIARFHTKSTLKDDLGAGAVDIVGQILIGWDSVESSSAAANGYTLIVDKKPVGRLRRGSLPFYPDPPKRTGPSKFGKFCKRFLPKNLGVALFDNGPPVGWIFEIYDETAFEDRKALLCSTLMVIEIGNWGRG